MSLSIPSRRDLKRSLDDFASNPRPFEASQPWAFSPNRIQRRSANPFQSDFAGWKMGDLESEADAHLVLDFTGDLNHVVPSHVALPRSTQGAAEVQRPSLYPVEELSVRPDSSPRPMERRDSSLSSLSCLHRRARDLEQRPLISLETGGGTEGDCWRLAELEVVAQGLADELSSTRNQLIAAVKLALSLSQQLDRQQFVFSQGMGHNCQWAGGIDGVKVAIPEPEASVHDNCDAFSSIKGLKNASTEELDEEQSRPKKRRVTAEHSEYTSGESEEKRGEGISGEDTEDLMRMMDSESRLCWQCHEQEAAAVTLPCRHLVLCKRCSSNAVECPKCLSCLQGVFHLAD